MIHFTYPTFFFVIPPIAVTSKAYHFLISLPFGFVLTTLLSLFFPSCLSLHPTLLPFIQIHKNKFYFYKIRTHDKKLNYKVYKMKKIILSLPYPPPTNDLPSPTVKLITTDTHFFCNFQNVSTHTNIYQYTYLSIFLSIGLINK